MSAAMNEVTLVGNLSVDPAIARMGNGSPVANLSLITHVDFYEKSGERKRTTEVHKVEIMIDSMVTLLGRSARKGSRLFVRGELAYRTVRGEDGRDHSVCAVMVRPFRGRVILMDNRDD